MAVWDTDVKQNSTIADRSGGFALEFMANRLGVMETGYRPVEVGAPYEFVARLRTSLNGANDTVEVTARWYTSAKVFISANNVHASAILSAANVWDTLSAIFDAPANAAFATVRVEKDDVTTAYVAYCDYAEVSSHSMAARAYISPGAGVQTMAGAAWRTVQYDTESYDHGSNFNVGTYQYTAESNGLHSFVVGYEIYKTAALTAGMILQVNLWKSGVLNQLLVFEGELTTVASAGNFYWAGVASGHIKLVLGETVYVRVFHTDAGNLLANIDNNNFAVAKVK